MKNKKLTLVLSLFAATAFMACGDDSSSVAAPTEEPASSASVDPASSASEDPASSASTYPKLRNILITVGIE